MLPLMPDGDTVQRPSKITKPTKPAAFGSAVSASVLRMPSLTLLRSRVDMAIVRSLRSFQMFAKCSDEFLCHVSLGVEQASLAFRRFFNLLANLCVLNNKVCSDQLFRFQTSGDVPGDGFWVYTPVMRS